jgi:hypothetical protein
MTLLDQIQTKTLDKGRLADTRNPGQTNALRRSGVGGEQGEQFRRRWEMIRLTALDQGDRLTDFSALTSQYAFA